MLTVKELRKMAKSREIKGYSSMRKSELCEALGLQCELDEPVQEPLPVLVPELVPEELVRGPVPVPVPVPVGIYHPYYNRIIDEDSPENCDAGRESLKKYLFTGDRKRGDVEAIQTLSKFCDFIKLENIQYIVGPTSYSEYRYGDMNIGIFGEEHGNFNTRTCIKSKKNSIFFNKFLKLILSNNRDYFYDFFQEMPYISKHNPVPNMHDKSMFSLIETDFYECLTLDKSRCTEPNLRAHYIDTRFTMDKKMTDQLVAGYLLGVNMLMMSMMDQWNRFASVLLKYVKNFLKTDLLLQKELSKSFLGKEISAFINGEFKKYEQKILSSQYADPETVTGMASLVMDAYALARLFRRFSVGNKPSEIRNAIMYVGDGHAIIYRKFIQNVLGIQPVINISVKTACLPISDNFKDVSFLFKNNN